MVAHVTQLNFGQGENGLSLEEANQLITVQRDILELVVTSSNFQETLEELCRLAENIVNGAVASIMLFDVNNQALRVRAGPNLPQEAVNQLNGLVPGPQAGSCGTAVHTQKEQFVCDTEKDPRWQDFQNIVRDFDLNACWSVPVLNPERKVIGSFALSSFEKRAPDNFQKNLLRTAGYIAGLVLQREVEDTALKRAAHYDFLTKLPNRTLFKMRAENAIARANRSRMPLAVFFVDLDKFKAINDEYGHDVGDEVLVIVSQQMNQCIRREDSLARIGGDEFVLMLEGLSDQEKITHIAEKIIRNISNPILLHGVEHRVGASIGICMYPEHGLSVTELIQNADKAMYHAKHSPDQDIQFYTQSDNL